MPIDLYEMLGSAPCLSVKMLLNHLKIPANLHHLNLPAGDHLKPEYLKLNPMHTIPTINDNGFALWESRTILRYLVNQYAPGNDLYPNDPKKRAIVDRMLDFDLGTLYSAAAQWMYPPIFKKTPREPEKEKVLSDKLQLFDQLLATNRYAAGEHLTIADLSLLASVNTFYAAGHNMDQYQNIKSWWNRLEHELPYYKELVPPHVDALNAWFAPYKQK
ncbi:glutathione S-transferase 1-1-like protein [Dinothrombium tinctorium]|uniref:Glutathione S-transferase 1-1-like protein n=1 Tax=Dinothrombium tinctorium TaxID=1965070 RepID=A0A3S3NSP1_9ACAR|nr:glutathione S-transferase 1-1-like protein [Dinothrombium tinctorium]RWS01082.1 glutathione S-transferase 1-1-like protein [Dinothrombium tinctorium]RWS01136.1 glutathione S-transferase 1-1-like protein [Dinothrombium tinctorium]RWS01149.1 glutathione S-transferase 1-1-like protein [Dinothrombium tinctorium]